MSRKFKHAKKSSLRPFRDGGFIAFDGTENEKMDFFDLVNSCHKHLKFTFEIAHNSVTFLDTLVFKGQKLLAENKLDLYRTSNQPILFSISIEMVHTAQQYSKPLLKENVYDMRDFQTTLTN